jgi:hypothetical protein
MINWKYCLVVFILIEFIYRLIIYSNARLFLEPFYITLINCPNDFLRFKCHLGLKRINFLTKFYHWYKMIYQCRIIELDFYLSNIIRSMEIVVFFVLLIDIFC